MATGVHEPVSTRSPLIVAVRTYLDHLVVERGLAENSVKSYRRDLRRYLGYLDSAGVTELDQITEQTVSGFLMALREGNSEHPPLSATSAGRSVVAVRGFHKFAVKDGLATSDPSVGVRPPSPAKRLPKAISLGDVERLLDAAGAPGTALALRDRALLEVLYGTGARISEAVGPRRRRPRDRPRRPGRQHGAAARQGLQGAHRSGRHLRARCGAGVSGAWSAGAGFDRLNQRRGVNHRRGLERQQGRGDVPERPGRSALAAERLGRDRQGRRTRRE